MPSDPSADRLLPDLTLRYAAHPDGVIDVHLPPGSTTADSPGRDGPPDGPGPTRTRRRGRCADAQRVVVLLHGGFWKTAYDREHVRPLARALAEDGFVVASPEYRRVGPGGAGGWPATGQDVVDATRALPELLEDAGIGTGPVTAVGHSAGGHLALWLATAVPLDRVVALAPVCDLREAVRRGLGSDAARAFLGGIEADRLDRADPMVLLDERPAAAITVLHGTRDDVVPVDLSRGLVARHPWIDLVELDADHFAVIEPAGPAYRALRDALRA